MTVPSSSVDIVRPRKPKPRAGHTLDDFIFCKRMKMEARCEKSAEDVLEHRCPLRVRSQTLPESLKIFMMARLLGNAPRRPN